MISGNNLIQERLHYTLLVMGLEQSVQYHFNHWTKEANS
jgi:hypothetical protein